MRARLSGSVSGSGDVVAVNNEGTISLLGLRYELKDAKISVADAGFDAGGKHFAQGSLIIQGASADALKKAIQGCGCAGGEPGRRAVSGDA